MNPEIVLGPPGTGKTTTLIHIVEEELARGVPPGKIGYFSFTRRAATEAVERAVEKFKLDRNQFTHFRTLHSMCFHQMGMRRGDVFEGARLREFAQFAGIRITGRWTDDGTFMGFEAGDRILFMENLARVRMIPLRDAYDSEDDNLSWSEVDRVARALAQFKEERQLVDFTDMLRNFVNSGISLGLDVLLVDEAQDLSAIQWQVVQTLAQGCRRVVIAGDDDQAIYRWAGADVDHLIDMPGAVRVLDQSYRVPVKLQDVAGGLISRVGHRREKVWNPRDAAGALVRASNFGDVDTSDADVMILARNAYIIKDQIEPELRRQGIVYERNGHPSIKTDMLEAIHTWEDIRAGKMVSVEAARLAYVYLGVGVGVVRGHKKLPEFEDHEEVNDTMLRAKGGLLAQGIWHTALDKLPADEMSYILAARRRGEKLNKRPRVKISTIHGAKGGQADHVILMKEMARRSYAEMEKAPDDEVRVWYVGVTRAKEKLTIVEAQTAQACPWL